MTRSISSSTTADHSPGTTALTGSSPTVAMSNTVNYILNKADELGVEDIDVEWYEENGTQIFQIQTHRGGNEYSTEVSHRDGPYEPKSIFYRSVDRSLEQFQERLPDQ